jgi:hypothetical protein
MLGNNYHAHIFQPLKTPQNLRPSRFGKSSIYQPCSWPNRSEELKWAVGPDVKIALLSNLTDHRFCRNGEVEKS